MSNRYVKPEKATRISQKPKKTTLKILNVDAFFISKKLNPITHETA